MSYRGYKSWRPNSRRNRRGSRSGGKSPQLRGSNGSLILAFGLFTLAVLAMLALGVYTLR